ncbi:MAG: glycosyltransferase [Anaerolineales bacterium]|nr:MAG: glycosyltransferase [Anaerolineales bacterium]
MILTPIISIIVPCFNEVATIDLLLGAIHSQTFPLSQLELIIADGGSGDGTLVVIEQFKASHPGISIQVISNPEKQIPAALNRAILVARGQYIVRLDAHSIPSRKYLQKCKEVLDSNEAANVGGLWDIQPGSKTWIERFIPFAAKNPSIFRPKTICIT